MSGETCNSSPLQPTRLVSVSSADRCRDWKSLELGSPPMVIPLQSGRAGIPVPIHWEQHLLSPPHLVDSSVALAGCHLTPTAPWALWRPSLCLCTVVMVPGLGKQGRESWSVPGLHSQCRAGYRGAAHQMQLNSCTQQSLPFLTSL